MFGARRSGDTVMNTVSRYSFLEGLPERVKESIIEFSEKHTKDYANSSKAVLFFARMLGEDYIVDFMRDSMKNPKALEMFDAIAYACMRSMNEYTVYENQVVDRKLARMLRAMSNLGGKPEEQYRLLKIFAYHEPRGEEISRAGNR